MIRLESVHTLFQNRLMVDFGMGGIPLSDLIVALIIIVAVVTIWWFVRGNQKWGG